jgi:hypothetical protein
MQRRGDVLTLVVLDEVRENAGDEGDDLEAGVDKADGEEVRAAAGVGVQEEEEGDAVPFPCSGHLELVHGGGDGR